MPLRAGSEQAEGAHIREVLGTVGVEVVEEALQDELAIEQAEFVGLLDLLLRTQRLGHHLRQTEQTHRHRGAQLTLSSSDMCKRR